VAVEDWAEPVPLPVDIIFVIDNSPSMEQEIAAIESNINDHFASVMDAEKVDYRVIMLSAFGSSFQDQSICIPPSLGGNLDCAAPDQKAGPQEGPRFFHYDRKVHSKDAACQVMKTVTGLATKQKGHSGSDDYPQGWQVHLREGAFKMFVLFTDDRLATCNNGIKKLAYGHNGKSDEEAKAAALELDYDLRTALPKHFGAIDGPRNYRWYTFGGFIPKPSEQDPYLPDEPIVEDKTPVISYDIGRAYQWLSKETGALRFSVNSTASYGPIFADMAKSAVTIAPVSCTQPLPEPPPKKEIVVETTMVNYLSGEEPAQELTLVATQEECGPGKFYVIDETVTLCPETCAVVQADDEAHLVVNAECTDIIT